MCRSPLGLRGLKSLIKLIICISLPSQPTRAAWIEIFYGAYKILTDESRSPLGLRGLKFSVHGQLCPANLVAAHSGCVD